MSRADLTADELSLPIKRTDASTLEERLTANAYHNILPARYLKKDADGNLAEQQEDLFERVANNVALAEAVYEADRRDVEVRVSPDQLKPDHPRRDELAAEVFGAGTTVEDDVETELTAENVSKFAYETVVPELPEGLRDHVEDVATEFRESMEHLDFMPNCVPPDSLVAAGGGMKPLSAVDPGERVYDDEDGLAEVEEKYRNGEKTVMEIETESGYSVRATPEHYFRVIASDGEYEWRQVKDITSEDVVALQKNFLDDDGERASLDPATGENHLGRDRGRSDPPERMTPELAEWLGLYVGDGTARESGVRVAFDETDEDLVSYWTDLTESLFGFEPTSDPRSDAACIIGRASRRDLFAFLDRNDLLKETSETATVPPAVLQSGRRPIAGFLRGLFEADGTVNERSIELYTHSRALASQVQQLLLGLGIRSKVREKGDGYRVTVRKNVCGRRFVERVGFLSERKRSGSERFGEVSDNATSVKVPNQTERLRDSPVADLVDRDQIYEEVSSVTEVGTMAVEDMKVPRRNTYVVEGFVSHNSPTLMNAGDELQQLSACFVMSPDDDLTDIHETAREAAEVFQSGGGVGYGFWQLRPYGDRVGSTGGIASGPITFMRTYDQLCETIAQGGTRRGAQMGIMRVSHPDVVQFIHAKNKDVSLAHTLRLNDPDDFTHNSFAEALDEARELIDDDGRIPKHLRNAAEGHLSNFNISVGVTDEFMDAVREDEEYTFVNPRTGDPHVATEETEELYSRFGLGDEVEVGEELSVPAREIWSRIVEGAHENGEPGVVFIDRFNEEHSFPVESTPTGDGSEYEMLATNPCVAEGTLVNTPDGPRPVEEVEVGDEISTVIGSEPVDEIETHEDYEVYRVEFSDGGSLDVTAQHRFHVLDEGKHVAEIPLHQLEEGDHVRLHPSQLAEGGTDEQYERNLKRGILLGDGCYTDSALDRNRVTISTSVEDSEYNRRVKELFGEDSFRTDDPYSEGKAKKMVLSDGGAVVQYSDLDPARSPEKSFDPTELRTESEVMGILDGLLATDGNVNLYSNHPQIRWDTASEDLAQAIRNALLNVGIHGRVTSITDPKRGGSINGRKISANNPKYTVNVSGASARRYTEKSRIDEIHPEKGEQMFELRREWMTTGNTWKARIESIEKLDETTTVYDLYCEESDTWITEGYVQQGCGEQPLMEYEACNLGHVNLSTVAALDAPDWRVWSEAHADEYDSTGAAVEAFLAEALAWEEFDHRIETGTRFLENVVTMSDFPIDRITETVGDNRKIGLGIMGLAQLYIQLGVEYGSEAGNEIARQVMRHINHGSKRASHELALERGSFANWEDSKYANPTEYREWFEKQTGEDADDWADGFPIRNHNTTTIAPTGCVEENSLVSTDEGLRPIKDLDDTGAEFEQWGEIDVGVSTDGGTKTATAVYDNGFVDVRRIETEGGFSVAATPDHRFRTIDENGEYVWRTAGEFEPGDRILLQRGTFDGDSRVDLDTSERENFHHNTDTDLTLPEEMTPALAEFLGYFMGDGYVHDGVGVKLVVNSDAGELDEYLRSLGESVFGVVPTVEERDTRHMLTFGGRHLPRYFHDNGWTKDDGNEGEGAASAFVPDAVLRGDEAVAKAFLRGLFEADGTASRKVELSTVSETLAKQVQTLLLSLGCVFVRDVLETEAMEDHYGDRPRYTVRGANKREDERFVDEVGFVTKSTTFDLTPQSYKNDTYPPAIVETLREVDGYDSVSDAVRKRVNQSPINGSVSRKLVKDVEAETDSTVRLDGRRLTDFYAATVESVSDETAYTKDISVPSNNTYVANGFVTHNTTSMVGNTTGGCEPVYNVAYYKNVSDDVQGDEMLVEFDDYFLRVLEDNGIDVQAVKAEAQEQMAANEFEGVESLDSVPDAIGELFVTTGDLSAKEHAAVQCACQEGVDSAISKTINAPNNASLSAAKDVFEYVYEHGGKGVTYYRDGTRSKQVLTTRAKNREFSDDEEAAAALIEGIAEAFGDLETFLAHEEVEEAFSEELEAIRSAEKRAVRPRPDALHGVSQRIKTGYGKLYVTINEDPETGEPFEVFANIGHSGGFTNSFTEAIGKITSSALRAGVDPDEIVDELCGTRSPKVAWDKGEQIQSIPDAIGTALRRYLDGEIDKAYPQQQQLTEVSEDDAADADARAAPAPETDAATDAGPEAIEDAPDAEPDGGAVSRERIQEDSQAIVEAGENPECPKCGALSLYYSEGCKTCEACGWSEC